eukprot:365452-Chlamydomonas_euryale.AAC.9
MSERPSCVGRCKPRPCMPARASRKRTAWGLRQALVQRCPAARLVAREVLRVRRAPPWVGGGGKECRQGRRLRPPQPIMQPLDTQASAGSTQHTRAHRLESRLRRSSSTDWVVRIAGYGPLRSADCWRVSREAQQFVWIEAAGNPLVF